MIFRKEFLKKIETGEVTLAFRQWKKLSISEGRTLKTPVGLILYKKIKAIKSKDIKKSDVEKSGFSELADLIRDLSGEGTIYRIEFVLHGPDPRIELRESTKLQAFEKEILLKKLSALDNSGAIKDWVTSVLNYIKLNPGHPSKEIAKELGHDQTKLKLNIRKLKNLGLTISLGTGYKLSPLGRVVLKLLYSSKK